MPNTKNATIRYQVLDRCFSDFRHRYYIEDLIEACSKAVYDYTGSDSVSRRTVLSDIAFMESPQGWDIPLERYRDGQRVYYRYEDKEFSINKKSLTAYELSQLNTTIAMLGRYRGLPAHAWLENIISSLEYRFGLKPGNDIVVEFEQNDRLAGIEYLSFAIEAAYTKQTLKICYQSYNGVSENWVIYPYYLKQYNNRWFLFGLNKYYEALSTIPLDRIVKIEKLDEPFIENSSVDFDIYFEDIVGVTVPNESVKKESVCLQFDRKRFPYIKTKPLHSSQKIIDEEKCIVRIDVRPNNELDSMILSFVPDVIVQSPEWYRKHICEKIEKNLQKYFQVQKDCTEER